MFKQALLLIILSMIAVFLLPFSGKGISLLMHWYSGIVDLFGAILSHGRLAHFVQQVLAVTLLPVIVGGAVGGGYWVYRRKQMPYVAMLIWTIWLVLVSILAARH